MTLFYEVAVEMHANPLNNIFPLSLIARCETLQRQRVFAAHFDDAECGERASYAFYLSKNYTPQHVFAQLIRFYSLCRRLFHAKTNAERKIKEMCKTGHDFHFFSVPMKLKSFFRIYFHQNKLALNSS